MYQYRASNISAGSQWRASGLIWTRLSRSLAKTTTRGLEECNECSKCESNWSQQMAYLGILACPAQFHEPVLLANYMPKEFK